VRSHIGIVSREFQVPCVMACTFAGDEPEAGREVELDCTGPEAIIRG
jgi:phosphoenolpyruvate-protein kinase (PTS system EI component)